MAGALSTPHASKQPHAVTLYMFVFLTMESLLYAHNIHVNSYIGRTGHCILHAKMLWNQYALVRQASSYMTEHELLALNHFLQFWTKAKIHSLGIEKVFIFHFDERHGIKSGGLQKL